MLSKGIDQGAMRLPMYGDNWTLTCSAVELTQKQSMGGLLSLVFKKILCTSAIKKLLIWQKCCFSEHQQQPKLQKGNFANSFLHAYVRDSSCDTSKKFFNQTLQN